MSLATFLGGFASAMFAVAGLFFFKFWRASRDSFFLYFTTASGLLALERIAVSLVEHFVTGVPFRPETGIWAYCVRLTAFIVIFVGIITKNTNARN